MKKKVFIIVLLVAMTALALLGYKTFLSPTGIEGFKNVTIQVVIEKENINKDFNFKTDHEFLIELLNENREKLGLSLVKYELGTMVTGVMNYVADENKNEYFHIYVNGLDATSGPDEIPLNDNDSYKFELKKW